MDPDASSTLLTIIASLVASGFFSGMEMAFVSANRLKVEMDSTKSLSGKLVASFFDRPQLFIACMLVGNNLALVLCGVESGALISQAIFDAADWNSATSPITALLVQTVATTIVVLITAEFIPKSLFHVAPNLWLNRLSFVLALIIAILAIPAMIIVGLSKVLLFPFFKSNNSSGSTEFGATDLNHYLEGMSAQIEPDGELEHELKIMQNALELGNIRARDCMVPRNEVVSVSLDSSISDIKEIFNNTGLSKIVVFDGDIDKITGYIHVKDLFKLPENISDILLPTFFIPEPMTGDELLKQFMRRRRHLAVVLDEFGGTAGILTMEDIVEELLGEIEDEHDIEDLIEQEISEKHWILSARHEVEYLNEKHSISLPTEDAYETLGGLILDKVAEIPEEGSELEIDGFHIKILKVEANRIDLIELKLL
ncbi:MAG: hemolysin family protein [Bacteroidota bacterium]|nr:hemolysin family protein [Bacteroidota bacterium]